jgi:small GTP-binding protein
MFKKCLKNIFNIFINIDIKMFSNFNIFNRNQNQNQNHNQNHNDNDNKHQDNLNELKEEIKVIFLGDPDVGKTTSLIKLLEPEQEVNITRSTIINFIQDKSHKDFNLIFYDTAGQERFNSLVQFYYRDVDIVLLFFDIMNADTFRNAINEWYKKIKEFELKKKIHFFLIANKTDMLKTDLDFQRINDPKSYAQENNMIFCLLNKKDPQLYINLLNNIQKISLQIIESRKEHLEQQPFSLRNYFFRKSNNNNNNSSSLSNIKTQENLNELFTDFYGPDWKGKDQIINLTINPTFFNDNLKDLNNLNGKKENCCKVF